MSTQKGNLSRTRPQKYQNKTKFKNDLHDTSQKTKFINNLEIENVCIRCKSILEWKIKYKKYKPLKSPSTCVKCHNKNVKHAYHIMCRECSQKLKVCPKCGLEKELAGTIKVVNVEDLLKTSEIQDAIKSLSERKRRTFYRHIKNPDCNITAEEQIIEKLKEISLSSGGSKISDDLSEEYDSDDDLNF